jgi:hypothetical protein
VRRLSKIRIALFTVLALTVLTLGGGLLYLESESFGNAVKRIISERSPQEIGVVGDFSHLKIYFFPPGIGIANPKIRIDRENVTNLPVEGEVEAKELRASFAPIQMFTGVLKVDEIEVNGGAVQGHIYSDIFKGSSSGRHSKPKEKLSWQDVFKLQINGVHFVDTYLNVTTELPNREKSEIGSEFVVKDLLLKKGRVSDRDGLLSTAIVRAVRLSLPDSMRKLPFREANQLQWDLRFNDQGLELEPFTLDISGIHLSLNGKIEGNLLDPDADPKLEGKVEVSSDVGTFFLANSNDDRWGGELELKGSVKAKLNHFEESLQARYGLEVKNFAYQQMTAALLRSEGEVDFPARVLKVKSVEVRDSGSESESGRIQISSFDLPIGLNRSFDAKLEFERADIHWLGGIVPREMAPLEAKISGKIGIQYVPEGKSWKLRNTPDLLVSDFALTNQKFGEKRPLKTILKPALPIHLKGGLEISPQGIDFQDLGLQLKQTQFKIAGGIHSGTGFDFTAKGPVDLGEIREIAGSPIRGEGTLEARIHGTPDELLLDFDPQVAHASYLDLQFGNLKGRVTYDDGISELRFTDIKANHKNTFYSLKEGFIDLSGSDEIHLPIEVNSGRIEDLAEVLHSLIKKISWYPDSLKGEIHGSVEVGGKVNLPEMTILSKLEGSDWTLLGERARKVHLTLGYDQGTYFAREVSILKSNGAFNGEIEFNASSDELDWNLSTEALSLNDFDFFDRLDIPARSKLEIESSGSGKMGQLKSTTRIRGFGTEVKGEHFQDSKFSLLTGENHLNADIDLFGGELVGQLRYALIPKQPSSFRMDLNRFDFSPTILILNPKLVDDPALIGRISGHIQLDFLSTQSELARGDLQVKEYRLAKTGFELKLIDPISVPVQFGFFQFRPTRFRFNQSELVLTGEGHKGDVDLRLQGQVDLALAEVLSSAVQKARGKAETVFTLKGPLKDLKLEGQVDFTNASVLTRWIQSPFEEMDGRILLNRGRIFIESLEAYLGDEIFSLGGKIDTFTDRFPELDLRATLENNKVKMDPFDYLQARGTVSIKGSAPPYRIGGNLELVQALYSKGFSQGSARSSTRGERFMPKDQDKQLASNLFELDLNVNANQGFFVRNEIIDAEFRGKARLLGAPDSPKLLGEGRLVQGKVLFKDRPFIFENAKVDFDDPYRFEPKFSASAVSEVNQYKIRVLAYGRSSQWKAEFSSTPYLKENEILAVLSSGGMSSPDSNRFATRDRSLVSQGEAASLILHSMDFGKDVQSKTGFQFDVEEAVDTQTATSIFRPQNLSENMAAPKVVLKRSVGRNMSVSFGSTVGVGSRNQKEVNAEYKLVPGVSMLGVWNNIEGVNTRESRTSFGLDLKFNRRFK